MGITKTYINSLNIDADTLDGVDSTQFLRNDQNGSVNGKLTVNYLNQVNLESITDANNITGTTFFRSHVGAENVPVATFAMGVSLGWDSANKMQIMSDRGSGTPLYVRKQSQGT